MRLCMTKRFVTAAEMSWLWPGTNGAKQSLSCHALLQSYMYSRSRLTGRKPNGPGLSGVVQASALLALLPKVVNVGVFERTLKSQGARDARFWTSRSHSAIGCGGFPSVDSQHQVS